MTTTSRRCPICKSDTAPARVVSTSGADASLEVTVKGMPVLECTQGHRLFALADFPLLLLDHLLEQDEPRLPVSQAKGMVFKHYSCSSCGGELVAHDDRSHTFHVDVELPELPRFGVDLTLPVSHCSPLRPRSAALAEGTEDPHACRAGARVQGGAAGRSIGGEDHAYLRPLVAARFYST